MEQQHDNQAHQASETVHQLPPPAVVVVPQQSTVGGVRYVHQQQTAVDAVLFVPVQQQPTVSLPPAQPVRYYIHLPIIMLA